MIKALTIRFGIMALGLGPLVYLVDTIKPAPGLALVALLLYMAAGALVIGNYCAAHEDEIPMRGDRDPRHR